MLSSRQHLPFKDNSLSPFVGVVIVDVVVVVVVVIIVLAVVAIVVVVVADKDTPTLFNVNQVIFHVLMQKG